MASLLDNYFVVKYLNFNLTSYFPGLFEMLLKQMKKESKLASHTIIGWTSVTNSATKPAIEILSQTFLPFQIG